MQKKCAYKKCRKKYSTNYKKKIYCSHECRHLHSIELKEKKVKKYKVICTCGNKFVSTFSRAKYCSRECYKKSVIERTRLKNVIEKRKYRRKITQQEKTYTNHIHHAIHMLIQMIINSDDYKEIEIFTEKINSLRERLV